MDIEGLLDLGQDKLFLYFTTFLLVMARIIGFFVQAPIWGSKHITMPVQIGFLTMLTIIIWPNVPLPDELPGGPITLILLIASQLAVGLVIGYISFIPMAMAQFGGEMMDTQMGLSSAAQYDPSSKGTINLIRRLYFYLTMTVFLMLDGHHTLLYAVGQSFKVIPLTGVRFSDTLITELIRITGEVFAVGMQIAMPVMASLFMVQIALGIMARVAPQMNVFMMSFPLNILTGLTLMVASMPLYIHKLPFMFDQAIDWIYTFIHYMKPS